MENSHQEFREKQADQLGQFLGEMLWLSLVILVVSYFARSSQIEIDLSIGKAMACSEQPCEIVPYRTQPSDTP
jgi:hypothetical protein